MNAKHGQVVWHDLITNDIEAAMSFYSELLGWEYQTEHAKDSVWKQGEAEYPLITVKGQAHGGFVNPVLVTESKWVAYVKVNDVDSVSLNASALGAAIEKKPFDVPGVGKSAIIRDPQGALICPFEQTHGYPPPSGVFLWDELITDDVEPEKEFYNKLFDWQAHDIDTPGMGLYTVFKSIENKESLAGSFNYEFNRRKPSFWLTYLSTSDTDAAVSKAIALGGELLMGVKEVPDEGRFAILMDPSGAKFGLFSPIK